MVTKNISNQPEPPTGISGFREIRNSFYEPKFVSNIPENWILEEYRLQSKTGSWIALQGPINPTIQRFISLDIYLIQPENKPQYESLEVYADYSRQQQITRWSQILFERDCLIDGIRGYEVKIVTPRTFPMAEGPVHQEIIKQWCIVFTKNGILEVIYEAPETDFERYYQAYDRFLKDIEFMP